MSQETDMTGRMARLHDVQVVQTGVGSEVSEWTHTPIQSCSWRCQVYLWSLISLSATQEERESAGTGPSSNNNHS